MSIRWEHQVTTMGRWGMARWAPINLSEAVEEVWSFEGHFTGLRECHFPSGNLDVVVHLNQVYHLALDEGLDPLPRLYLSGQLVGPLAIEASAGRISAVGIRLRPAGAFAVLGQPLHPLTGCMIDLKDVTPAASELEDRCSEARSLDQRVRAAADWVRERMVRARAPDPDVTWAASEIVRAGGDVAIESLTRRIGRARGSFTDAFRDQIGVTPRFQRLLKAYAWKVSSGMALSGKRERGRTSS